MSRQPTAGGQMRQNCGAFDSNQRTPIVWTSELSYDEYPECPPKSMLVLGISNPYTNTKGI